MWGLGVVTQLLLGNALLFACDRDDNVRNAVELKKLATWSSASVSSLASDLSLSLLLDGISARDRVAAVDMICWLLQPEPKDRPTSCSDLLRHPLLLQVTDDGSAEAAEGGQFGMPPLHIAAATGALAHTHARTQSPPYECTHSETATHARDHTRKRARTRAHPPQTTSN